MLGFFVSNQLIARWIGKLPRTSVVVAPCRIVPRLRGHLGTARSTPRKRTKMINRSGVRSVVASEINSVGRGSTVPGIAAIAAARAVAPVLGLPVVR